MAVVFCKNLTDHLVPDQTKRPLDFGALNERPKSRTPLMIPVLLRRLVFDTLLLQPLAPVPWCCLLLSEREGLNPTTCTFSAHTHISTRQGAKSIFPITSIPFTSSIRQRYKVNFQPPTTLIKKNYIIVNRKQALHLHPDQFNVPNLTRSILAHKLEDCQYHITNPFIQLNSFDSYNLFNLIHSFQFH